MNDTDTLPRHMLDIRELTAEAFAPYGQVVAPLRVPQIARRAGRRERSGVPGFTMAAWVASHAPAPSSP